VGETSGEIETHIRNARDDLSANLSELEQKVKTVTDWRQQYQKSSGTFLAAAAGAGVLLALLTRGNRSASVAPSPIPSIPRPRGGAEFDHSIGTIKSALIGVAASKAISLLSQLLPGFEDHPADREKKKRSADSRAASDPPLAH
jgi:hypothetical protein